MSEMSLLALLLVIAAYFTVLSWFYRISMNRLEAEKYAGRWIREMRKRQQRELNAQRDKALKRAIRDDNIIRDEIRKLLKQELKQLKKDLKLT